MFEIVARFSVPDTDQMGPEVGDGTENRENRPLEDVPAPYSEGHQTLDF